MSKRQSEMEKVKESALRLKPEELQLLVKQLASSIGNVVIVKEGKRAPVYAVRAPYRSLFGLYNMKKLAQKREKKPEQPTGHWGKELVALVHTLDFGD